MIQIIDEGISINYKKTLVTKNEYNTKQIIHQFKTGQKQGIHAKMLHEKRKYHTNRVSNKG